MSQELVNLDELNMSEQELFAPVEHDEFESEKITAPRYSYWKSVFRVFFKKKTNFILLALLALIIIMAYLYPLVTNYDRFANVTDLESKHLSPSQAFEHFGPQFQYILGTGTQGESTMSAVWYGAEISLSLAFICAAINMTIGVVLGAIWGFSKRVDMVMTEVYNIIGNVPYILLVGVLVLVMSPSFWTLVFALTVTGWIGIAYFIRTQVIIIRDREYNLASKCLGTNIFRLTAKNILPYMTSVIVTMLATEIPSYISTEVFLSFIGMGLSEVSLGQMIQTSQVFMTMNPWEFWSPVAVASIITIVLYVVGQNLGDASDPRTHM